jgi:rhamnopyranosyl-N-acetylglucosaminyl-diphospho-decaprenol beta-1,3/1,4-galactofuranosyltransferase
VKTASNTLRLSKRKAVQMDKLVKSRIAAVVLTYKGERVIRNCLAALMAQTRALDEIIVIDNGGDAATIIREYPTITYRMMTENVGSSGGYYEGLKLAYENGHDWIWTMDDDAVADSDALEHLLRNELLVDDSTDAVASTVLNKDRTINRAHRRLFVGTIPAEHPADLELYRERPYFETDTITYMGMLIGRQAISKIGLPLQELFIYFDDIEYALRMRKRGGKIFTVTTSFVVDPDLHRAPNHTRTYYLRRNRIYVYKKYRERCLHFYLTVLIGIIKGQLGILRSESEKMKKSWIFWLATVHGLTGKLGKCREP